MSRKRQEKLPFFPSTCRNRDLRLHAVAAAGSESGGSPQAVLCSFYSRLPLFSFLEVFSDSKREKSYTYTIGQEKESSLATAKVPQLPRRAGRSLAELATARSQSWLFSTQLHLSPYTYTVPTGSGPSSPAVHPELGTASATPGWLSVPEPRSCGSVITCHMTRFPPKRWTQACQGGLPCLSHGHAVVS